MDKWEALSRAMQEENANGDVFLAERITPENLRRTFEEGRAVKMEQDGEIVGYAALWLTPAPDWLEVGSLFVVKRARGNRISSTMYPLRIALIPKGVRSFVVSHNERAVHHALHFGYQEATAADWFRLAPYTLVCGPCDRVTEGEKAACPFRAVHSECRLFVR